MKEDPSVAAFGKARAIFGTALVIIGVLMLIFAGIFGFTLLPLTFGGIVLVFVGIYIAKSARLITFINDMLR